MKTSRDILDAVKRTHSLRSDYALAKFLGITRAQVSKYRCDRDSLSDKLAIQTAEAIGVDFGFVLALVAAERADRNQNEFMRSAWDDLAGRLDPERNPPAMRQ